MTTTDDPFIAELETRAPTPTDLAEQAKLAYRDSRTPPTHLNRYQYARHLGLGHALSFYRDADDCTDDEILETATKFTDWIQNGGRTTKP
jgi:hypothetical protein